MVTGKLEGPKEGLLIALKKPCNTGLNNMTEIKNRFVEH
jgi:hypothetical protein